MAVPRFSRRLDNIGLSVIRQIMAKAGGCINLGIGEPDFYAPETVRSEAARILREEKIHYSPNAGLPDLCQAIVEYHGGHKSHNACVTNGSQEALFDLIFALIDPGDEVLIPDPGFVAYDTVVRLAGGMPVRYRLPESGDFDFVKEELSRSLSSRCRAIVVNSPSNPTGRCLSLAQLRTVAEQAAEAGALLISDEIYREMYYTADKPSTIAKVTDQAVILSGVSKMAGMTGWRVGWACGPREIMQRTTVMHQYTSSCASTLSQKAALSLFSPAGWAAVEAQRLQLSRNLEQMNGWIESNLGRRYVRPEGALYVMLSVKDLAMGSFEIAQQLIQEGVATIPGVAFGPEGEGFLRLSFGCQPDQIEKGLLRLKKGLEKISPKVAFESGAGI